MDRKKIVGLFVGCTEIPLAVQQTDFSVLFMDPMEILSKAAVRACMHCKKADDE